jgi:hypothetical protein
MLTDNSIYPTLNHLMTLVHDPTGLFTAACTHVPAHVAVIAPMLMKLAALLQLLAALLLLPPPQQLAQGTTVAVGAEVIEEGPGGAHHSSSGDVLLLSPVFSSAMVLQRAPRSSRLFGTAAAGAVVSVTLAPAQGQGGATAHTTAGKDGKWVAALPPQPASKGRAISVSSSSSLGGAISHSVSLLSVSFGEVFLCTGQSNMAVEVGNRLMMNQSAELAGAHL